MPWKLSEILKRTERFSLSDMPSVSGTRIASVDALRGFDMFWIIGGDIGFQSLDNVFNSKLTAFIKNQFDHAEWFGFHFEDIIMPLFLFLVGLSMTFSFRKRLEKGEGKREILIHTLKRVLLLWFLGMIVQGNLLSYDPSDFRFYTNTLQAIASGYLIASLLILYLPLSSQFLVTMMLMFSYWVIIGLFPLEGEAWHRYDPENNVAMIIERTVMGRHIGWGSYTWLLSSLNFGATVMLGVYAGYLMMLPGTQWSKFRQYLVSGILLILISLFWDILHPIIKKIWTGSFVLFSGGISFMLFALFYFVIDILRIQNGIRWMTVIGSNAITAYVAWHLFGNNFMDMASVFLNGLKPCIDEWYITLRIFGGTLILYFILLFLYRRKIFIKI